MGSIKMYTKKKVPVWAMAVSLVVLLVAGYYIAGIFTYDGLTIYNLEDAFAQVLLHPLKNYWNDKTIPCMGIALVLWCLVVSYIFTYYRNFQDGIENGSAEWLDVYKANKELENKENETDNRILSQNLKVGFNRLSNNNMMLMGASGSYKTTSVMHQNLLQFGSAYVVLDVKGDTQRSLGNAFIKHGYTVKSLNFKEPQKSDRINPMIYIENEEDLLRVVQSLQSAVRRADGPTGADPFWDDGVRLYLNAMFYYEWLDAREHGRPHGEFNNILMLSNMENQKSKADPEVSKLQEMMDKKAAEFGDDYPPVRDYRKLKEGAPDTVRSIIIMVNAMFAVFETAEVKRIFSGNDIDIREIGTGVGGDPDKKIVLFLVIPDNNNVYNFIISMFYTQMFDILIRLSDNELHKPLPVRVEFWLDEFYAGARPQDTETLLGVVRSRNISIVVILQSIAQIKTLYQNDKWEIFNDNMAAFVYLGSGPAAHSTHEFISSLLGDATQDVRSDNIHHGSGGSSGLNFQRQGRRLMTESEVKGMPMDRALVFLESRSPIIDYKAIPFDQPRLGYTAPKRLKDAYSEAMSCGPYEHPVYTVYDQKHLRYITVEKEKRLKILEPDEACKYRQAAESNPKVQYVDIHEQELVYVNFQDDRKKDVREIKKLFKKIAAEEKFKVEEKNRMVLMLGIEPPEKTKTDKSQWESLGSFSEDMKIYFDKLSFEEQEEILLSMDSGLTDEQLDALLFMALEDIPKYRQIYMTRNKFSNMQNNDNP